MPMNPYILKFRSSVRGNSIPTEAMQGIRSQIVMSTRQIAATKETHEEYVSNLQSMADSTALLPNGVWTNGDPMSLRMQADGLQSHYEEEDSEIVQQLFESVYDADREVARSGIYEVSGDTILGKADLVDGDTCDMLDTIGHYSDYAMGRMLEEQAQQQAEAEYAAYRAGTNPGYAAKHSDPNKLSGVSRPVKADTRMGNMSHEQQFIARRRMTAEIYEGYATGPIDPNDPQYM